MQNQPRNHTALLSLPGKNTIVDGTEKEMRMMGPGALVHSSKRRKNVRMPREKDDKAQGKIQQRMLLTKIIALRRTEDITSRQRYVFVRSEPSKFCHSGAK